MAFNQFVCLQYFRFPTVEHASLQTYQRRLSVRTSVSLTCIPHGCMPNFYSLLNALGSMNVGLMQMHAFVAIIEDILSSHDKNQIHVQYTTKRACTLIVNVPVIIEPFHQYSRNGNPSWLILIPTPSKPTAYSSVISSWRLLNQENARTRATWRTSTQCPCIVF